MKKKLIIASLALSLPLISACTKDNSANQGGAQKQQQKGHVQIDVQEQILAINGLRCIGCGRCANIAPKNFEMDRASGKALVVSQANLDSLEVQKAIEECPTQVLSL